MALHAGGLAPTMCFSVFSYASVLEYSEFLFAGCAHNVNRVAGLEITDMAATGSWMLVLPIPGLLFVDWGWPARQSASDPGGNEDWPGRSTDKQHVFGVLLMTLLKFEDSSSIQVLAVSFVLDDLYCRRWRKSRLRQRWSATAMGAGWSCNGSACIFLLFRGAQTRSCL